MVSLTVIALVISATLAISAEAPPRDQRADCANSDKWRNIIDHWGRQMFLIGDRTVVFPNTTQEVADIHCKRIKEAIDRARPVIRECMKPFAKQVIGLLVNGIREQNKRTCTTEEERQNVVNHFSCANSPYMEDIHMTMDTLIAQFEVVRDIVEDKDLHLPYTCCYYNEFRKNLIAKAALTCEQDDIDWILTVVDGCVEDALDLTCKGHEYGSAKCKKLLEEKPISIQLDANRKPIKKAKSFLLPLTDIYTNL